MDKASQWLLNPEQPLEKASRFAGLDDVGKSVVLGTFALRTRNPILVVFPTKAEARAVVDNLGWLLGKEKSDRIHYIPHLDSRLLPRIASQSGVGFEARTPLFSCVKRCGRPDFYYVAPGFCLKGDGADGVPELRQNPRERLQPDRDELVHSLLDLGYRKQPNAYDPGVFPFVVA
jgi:hypothetical protein